MTVTLIATQWQMEVNVQGFVFKVTVERTDTTVAVLHCWCRGDVLYNALRQREKYEIRDRAKKEAMDWVKIISLR